MIYFTYRKAWGRFLSLLRFAGKSHMPPRIGFNVGFWTYPVDGLKSVCQLNQEQLLASIDLCWHMAAPWYRTDSLVVPIPVTTQAAPAFFTNVFKVGGQLALFEGYVSKTAADQFTHRMIALPNRANNPAKYAEVVLYKRSSLDQPTTPNGTEWEAMFVRALPVPDVPPKPEHMVAHLGGKEASKWPYTTADFAKSITFWQQYCTIK